MLVKLVLPQSLYFLEIMVIVTCLITHDGDLSFLSCPVILVLSYHSCVVVRNLTDYVVSFLPCPVIHDLFPVASCHSGYALSCHNMSSFLAPASFLICPVVPSRLIRAVSCHRASPRRTRTAQAQARRRRTTSTASTRRGRGRENGSGNGRGGCSQMCLVIPT